MLMSTHLTETGSAPVTSQHSQTPMLLKYETLIFIAVAVLSSTLMMGFEIIPRACNRFCAATPSQKARLKARG